MSKLEQAWTEEPVGLTLTSGKTGEQRTVRYARFERDPDFREREARHWQEPCEYCGRKVGKRDLWVFIGWGMDLIHPDDAPWVEEHINDYVGWYRVGPTCAKRFKGWTLTIAQQRARRVAS